MATLRKAHIPLATALLTLAAVASQAGWWTAYKGVEWPTPTPLPIPSTYIIQSSQDLQHWTTKETRPTNPQYRHQRFIEPNPPLPVFYRVLLSHNDNITNLPASTSTAWAGQENQHPR